MLRSKTTLDRVIEDCGQSVSVLKIDIEGHEFKAFRGAQRSLGRGKVRDIILEDHEGMSSEVSRLLREFGYSIFGLNKTIFGPVLLGEKSVNRFRMWSDDTLNFLATRDSMRASRRMSGRGYKCLGRCS